ncbi:MAG: cupredoxin domain-containing protein [Actinomycetota bacterium]
MLLGAGIFAAVGLSAGARTTSTHASKVTINVTASEWKFKLSKTSVPVGTTVVFKVTNKGKIGHNFVIAGKKTKLLNPGQTQSITVKFAKKGKFTYLCSVTGHAKLGMQGVFGVGVTPPPPTTSTTTTTTTGNVGTAVTTVNVNMVEYAFQLSQATIPSGTVTFVIKNSGAEVHNFDINGVHSGALLSPGATETWTVKLAPGQYLYTCDVPFHVDKGMTGAFQVTP